MEDKKITFSDIKTANEAIMTIDVKGKDYSAVNERIKAFRMNHPLGSIATNIEKLENGVVVMSCEVRDENEKLLGKAYAYEKEGSTFINKTSYIENCCTSCTGRALGYAGYGIDLSVCSAEEVQNAIAQQNEKLEDKTPLITRMHELIIEKELELDIILKKVGVKRDIDMTIEQLKNTIKILEGKKEGK